MQPTVGRIVHYHAPRGEPFGSELVLVPAVVAEVQEDRLIVCVLDPQKGVYFRESRLVDGEPQPGRWQWPPLVMPTPPPAIVEPVVPAATPQDAPASKAKADDKGK